MMDKNKERRKRTTFIQFVSEFKSLYPSNCQAQDGPAEEEKV